MDTEAPFTGPQALADTAARLDAFANFLSESGMSEEARRQARDLHAQVALVDQAFSTHNAGLKALDALEDIAAEEQLEAALSLLDAVAAGRPRGDMAGKIRLVTRSIEAFASPPERLA